MSVSAKYALRVAMLRMSESALRDFVGKAQPASVQPVEEADEGLAFMVDFLKMQIDELANPAEEEIIDNEAVELVSVNGEVANALILPHILPIDGDADQMRHQVRESLIVIAFDPNDFRSPLGI